MSLGAVLWLTGVISIVLWSSVAEGNKLYQALTTNADLLVG